MCSCPWAKGPFKYYVRMFLVFLGPPTYKAKTHLNLFSIKNHSLGAYFLSKSFSKIIPHFWWTLIHSIQNKNIMTSFKVVDFWPNIDNQNDV